MSTAELAQMAAAGYGFAQQFATEAATMPGELLLPLLPGDRTAPHRQHAYASVQGSLHDLDGRRPIDRMTAANHNDESPTVNRQEQGQYICGDSQQLSDLAAFRAAQAAEQAPGYTFTNPPHGDRRHQPAPADRRRHAPHLMVTVVTNQRLLTVAGMRPYILPSSCPTVVGSWIREYPFRICVNFRICVSRRRHIMVVSSTRVTNVIMSNSLAVWRTSSWSESLSVS